MKNSLTDLNNYLFQALEEVQTAEGQEELDEAIKRAKAVRDIGTVIVNNANIMVKALKYQDEKNSIETKPVEYLLTGDGR